MKNAVKIVTVAAKSPIIDNVVDKNEHTKEMLEKEFRSTLVDAKEFKKLGYGEFIKWLSSIARYGILKIQCYSFGIMIIAYV